MMRFAWLVVWCGLCGAAVAALPPPDDAAKLRTAQLLAKSEWQRKVDGYLLCKAQDRIAAHFRKTGEPAASIAAVPIPPCVNPPPFAHNEPAQTPLETSGAHSPTGTAASAPSVRQPSSVLAPSSSRRGVEPSR
jgi:hypothetical protein